MKIDFRFLIICIAVSIVFGALAGFFASQLPKSEQQMIHEFYVTENAVAMSPVDYINSLQGDAAKITLVDLRIKSDYDASHLVGAVDIPAQTMSAEQVVSAFRALPQGRPIVIYCYSTDCTISQSVGLTLSQNGIYVKHLTSGWIEIQDLYSGYVVSGPAPGTLNNVPAARGGCGTGGNPFKC